MQALGHLYARHGAGVRSLVLRCDPSAGPEGADEVCQETFLTFYDTLSRYEHRGALKRWLYGIALKKARNRRRRWWHRLGIRQRAGAEAAGVAVHHHDIDARIDAHTRIAALMAALPAAQREVIALVHIEGLSVQQAAEILAISDNAVSTRLYRARAALGGGR
ncbi:MAG: RNA polymerase sigma factor [Myxococcota bacterium]